jgi:hypothetical protein
MKTLILLLLCIPAALADTTVVTQLDNGTVFTTTVGSSGGSTSSVAVPLPGSALIYQINSAGQSSTTFVLTAQPRLDAPCRPQ